MKKKILIIGNGAREYALAKKMSEKHEVFVTPGSDTLKDIAVCLDIRPDNVTEILEFVLENGIDMTIPICSEAIKANIAETFSENKLYVFAPTAKANKMAEDKFLSKKILYKLRIPTPKFGIFEKVNQANDYAKNQQVPFVIKNNSAHSAVAVTSLQTAKSIIDNSFIDKNNKILIEDYIYGFPFSFYAITDGYKALPFGSSLTYKHALEGNGGQLTNGMGACSPNFKLSLEHEYFLMDKVIYPILDYLEIEKNPYTGIIGVNGILTSDGEIFVLNLQTFMQDCDCVSILNCVEDDLYSLFESCIIGSFSDEVENVRLNDNYSVSVILNCINKKNNENVITGIENISDNTIITYFSNVKKNRYFEYEAENGPVLILTAQASSINKAQEKVYDDVKEINFNGINYRKDICETANI